MRTVDLVVGGDGSGARAAAVCALRRGHRVLVVLSSADPRIARQLRRHLRKAGGNDGQLRIMMGAEVVCVDGVDAVEAVVVRRVRTGHLFAVNASGFDSGDLRERRQSGLRFGIALLLPVLVGAVVPQIG